MLGARASCLLSAEAFTNILAKPHIEFNDTFLDCLRNLAGRMPLAPVDEISTFDSHNL